MTGTLVKMRVKQSRLELREGYKQCDSNLHYFVLDTVKLGRLMFIHGGKDGDLAMDEDDLYSIFMRNDCDATVCCYPYQQYQYHPELAEAINILFPKIKKEIYSDTRRDNILILGWCDGRDFFTGVPA